MSKFTSSVSFYKMCFIAACSQRGSTTDTYKSFSLQCKDRQLIHFRPSNKFTTDKHNVFFISCHLQKKKRKKIAVIQSSSNVDLIWPYSKINLARTNSIFLPRDCFSYSSSSLSLSPRTALILVHATPRHCP